MKRSRIDHEADIAVTPRLSLHHERTILADARRCVSLRWTNDSAPSQGYGGSERSGHMLLPDELSIKWESHWESRR